MSGTTHPSLVGRTLVLLYGVSGYLAGVAGLACVVLALAQIVPFGFMDPAPVTWPVVWNLTLVAAWGGIHSVMARDGFKRAVTRLLPEPAERPTYVWVAGVTSVLLVGLWQHVDGIVWTVTNGVAVAALWTVFGFGWAYLLAATFAIDHFDLFGLRQVYFNFVNRPRPPIGFVKRAMYRHTRHPIQTGVLIGVWATPAMTATHLVLSLAFTAYVFVGLWFEERDLIRHIGPDYETYRQEAGMLLPRLRR